MFNQIELFEGSPFSAWLICITTHTVNNCCCILYYLFEAHTSTSYKDYPNLDKYDGFAVKDRIVLSRGSSTGGPIDPEKAKKYLPLLRENLDVKSVMWLERDGISLEEIASFDEKFSGISIMRFTMNDISPERALELSDRQLKRLGVSPKNQSPSIRRWVANALFLALQGKR